MISIRAMTEPVNDKCSLQPRSLEESLYATIAYFDAFNYPLTPHELWAFLLYPPDDCSISEVVETSKEHPFIEWSKGFAHLKERNVCVQERIERYIHTERKVRKAMKFALWCSLVPGVAMIALCNTLAFSHARDGSDIDLFIVARKGHLWFVRAACIVLSLFFGPRLSEQHMRDALCLSFFIREDALDLSSLALPCLQGIDDVYLAIWVSRLVPIYDEGDSARLFWEANQWAAKIIPHRMQYVPSHVRRISHGVVLNAFKKIVTVLYSPFLRHVERVCKVVQQKKFPSDIRAAAHEAHSGVVISDTMLKFHLNDRRAYFVQQLIERLYSYRSRSI